MAWTPTDISNRSLDAIAAGFTIGDIEEGTAVAQIALRQYSECRKQLLRASHWQFARKQEPMLLLADATGNTPNVGKLVVDPQFIYEYAWPTDCLKIIYIPWFWQNAFNPGVPPGNITPPNPGVPQTTGASGQPPYAGQRPRPAPYIVTSDPNYPPATPTLDTPGVSPLGRTVICTNVQNAALVYIYDALYPQVWDPLFNNAMVAYLASELALPVWAKKDRKFGLQMRQQQIAIAKDKIAEARVADGNDSVTSSNVDVNWMDVRRNGRGFGGWGGPWGGGSGGGGGGGFGYGQCSFTDGSYF